MTKFLDNMEDIHDWLRRQDIRQFKIKKHQKYNFVVDVFQDVMISFDTYTPVLDRKWVKFNVIHGDFMCRDNDVDNLDWAPIEVKEGFYVSNNKLTSLIGCPQKVDGDFDASTNKLTTLEGAPKKINGIFNVSDNNLSSLLHFPALVQDEVNLNDNRLKSLLGGPKLIWTNFRVSRNRLKSLEGCPESIAGFFEFADNGIENLIYFPKKVGSVICCEGNKLPLEVYNCNNEGFESFEPFHQRDSILSEQKRLNSSVLKISKKKSKSAVIHKV